MLSSVSSSFSSLFLSSFFHPSCSFFFCYYGVPLLSFYLCIVQHHSAHVGLVQRSHRNCAALVGGGGWHGGQICGKRDKEKESHTLTHVVDKMVWWVHTMWPLPIVVAALLLYVRPGAWPERRCFLLFESCVTIFSGVPNARRKCFSFSLWHLLSLERIVRVNRGAEGALECFEE